VTTTESLFSFVPQVVRRRVLAGQTPALGVEYVDGVVLASDVSGFTQLALSMRDTPDAIEELSTILNSSFSDLIDVIAEAGGDVLGFAGDALMAYWPSGPDAAVSAGWAALEAQRRLAEGDHRIRLRVGLGAGTIALATVGGEGNRWFLTLGGAAPAEAAAMQSRAALGQVAVSDGFVQLAGAASATSDVDGVRRLVAVEGSPSADATGAASGGSLDESTLATLRPYVPVSVFDRLIAGHDYFLSELRTVTVGLLATPGLEDPDRLAELQDVVAAVQRSTYAYGGVVDPGVDDKGVTFRIAFGVPPFAHEDDVDRALAAVLAIDRELTGQGVDHGIGVKTGPAFCGTLGNDVRREYALLSDIVSMAARLAGAARDPARASVLCDVETAEVARSRWSFDTPMSLRLKSSSELYTAFGLLDRVARARLGTDAILGREKEIEQVCELVATPPSGPHGRLVVIEGEPGIGKSSLLGAVEQALQGTGVTMRIGFADSLERSAPFQAWSAVFGELLDVSPLSRADVADHLLARVGPRAPLLSPVLAIDVPDTEETASLAGEQRVAATQSLLLELLAADRDSTGSLVVLLEDAHWFDSASWALLADALALKGIVVAITTRPESAATGRELARVGADAETISIHLEPLPADEVRRLAQARLDVAEIDDRVEAMLSETCKGNPFFVVELVQALAQRGALVVDSGTAKIVEDQAVHVPTTIQAAITSRVDSLSADQQLTIKVASVVGSEFDVDLLTEIHPTARPRGGLAQDLGALVDQGLIGPGHDVTYEFNHALTREVAYGLMTGDQRRALHRSLATFYESAGEDLDYLYPELAHHWLQAEDDDKAVSYLTLAAVSSLAHGMPRESVTQGVKAARVLGIELDVDPAKIVAVLPAELAEIDRLIAGRRPADLAALPELIDEEISRGIGIVLQSMPSAHQSLQTELFALMAIRNLNLTLRFGAGPLAPGVYAMYSVVLRGLGADSALAYEFSELARTVDAPTHLLAPVVDFVHIWFNNHWFNPIRTGIPIAMKGAEAGLAGADRLYGSFNLAAATTLLATGGSHLDEVIETGERHLARIGTWSDTASFHNRLEAQMAKALSGRTESLTSLTDEVADEQELAAMVETANFNQAAYYHIAKLRLAYLAGDPKAALAAAEKAYELLPSFAGQVGQAELTVLAALAQLAELPENEASRAEALDSVGEKLAQLEAWSASCRANFAHKASLVRGELAAAMGESAAAEAHFGEAEREASAEGFPQWAALACERRGHAARSRESAATAFSAAAAHYRTWGASRKSDELEALAAA
jgi:predicted ATPase/class 3 adenylate cyclase